MSDITIYESLANAIILQAVKDYRMAPVSYTHLTLPTTERV